MNLMQRNMTMEVLSKFRAREKNSKIL